VFSGACSQAHNTTQNHKPPPMSTTRPPVKPQGKRAFFQDYRQPWFYMVTMTTLHRLPLFGVCQNNTVELSQEGEIARALLRALPQTYPQLEIQSHIFMPDHLHCIFHVTEHMPQPLGVPIRAFKSQVTSALRKKTGNFALQVWNPGYHDAIVVRKGALAAFANYIRDNPRRYCLKKANPELFTTVNNLRHARLPPLPPRERWQGYVNLFLLDKPLLLNVRVSRRATPAELETIKERVREALREGTVIVSPFISPGEKAVAEMVLGMSTGELIVMKPAGFPPCYRPGGRYFNLCAQGRLLILSAFAHTPKPSELTRERCLAMNTWCENISKA
jgi:REP element-mobilizing transposase RayT